MRLLADENVPTLMVETLRSIGHDVDWVRDTAPSSPDTDVLAQANDQDRVLVTYDTDFGELVFARGMLATTGVILLRLPQPTLLHTDRLVEELGQSDEWSGYFTTITATDARHHRLPQDS